MEHTQDTQTNQKSGPTLSVGGLPGATEVTPMVAVTLVH